MKSIANRNGKFVDMDEKVNNKINGAEKRIKDSIKEKFKEKSMMSPLIRNWRL